MMNGASLGRESSFVLHTHKSFSHTCCRKRRQTLSPTVAKCKLSKQRFTPFHPHDENGISLHGIGKLWANREQLIDFLILPIPHAAYGRCPADSRTERRKRRKRIREKLCACLDRCAQARVGIRRPRGFWAPVFRREVRARA